MRLPGLGGLGAKARDEAFHVCDLSLLVGVVVVLAITVATGYFVAQEFAYMTVDRARLQSRARSGDRAAARTLDITPMK